MSLSVSVLEQWGPRFNSQVKDLSVWILQLSHTVQRQSVGLYGTFSSLLNMNLDGFSLNVALR